jgi:hypothetical protein
MAELLQPYNNSRHNNNTSFKYKLDCQKNIDSNDPDTKEWLSLLSQIEHKSDDFKLFIGLLEKKKNIVVKIGTKNIETEYVIGNYLDTLNLSTFIEYNCMFSCLDKFSEINTRTKSLCKKNGEIINILVMPFIKEGRIDKYLWTRHNFTSLLNIIKHTVLSILFAGYKIGFAHGDLHLGNIMITKTKKKNINYEDLGILEIENSIIPVIMDYEKSLIQTNPINFQLIYNSLLTFITLIGTETDLKLNVANVISFINVSFKQNTPITSAISHNFMKLIDNITINYVASEIKQKFDFLQPLSTSIRKI